MQRTNVPVMAAIRPANRGGQAGACSPAAPVRAQQIRASLVDAVGASCAVPGLWPPVTIGERRFMDGGMRTVANADLAHAYERVVIVAPVAAGIGFIASPAPAGGRADRSRSPRGAGPAGPGGRARHRAQRARRVEPGGGGEGLARDVLPGSPGSSGVQGSGVAAASTRALPNFSGIDLAGSNNVTIVAGARQSVVVHADSNLLSHVTTQVRAGTLIIGTSAASMPRARCTWRSACRH